MLLIVAVSLALFLTGSGNRAIISDSPAARPTSGPYAALHPTPVVAGPSASGPDVGFRSSVYGIEPMPAPDYWYRAGADEQRKLNASGIGGVWVIGYAEDDGTCYLNFPSMDDHPGVAFSGDDENEQYLSYFDHTGIRVYLQVEPGTANIDDLIRLVLDRYAHHSCVAGMGIDAEWYGNPGGNYPEGRPVTDQEAARWYEIVRSYNASYKLLLKHWLSDHMPPSYRKGIYFVCDSMGFSSMDEMAADFASWGKKFPNNDVGFQIGYPDDKGWWGKLDNPFTTIGQAIIAEVPNVKGIYWVDFCIRDIYPA